LRPGSVSGYTSASKASLNCGDTSGFLPAGRSEGTSVGKMCSGGARLSEAPRIPGRHLARQRASRRPLWRLPWSARPSIESRPATVLGGTRRGGGWIAIAAEPQEHVHVGSTEMGADLLRWTHAPLAQSAEHIHGKENPGAILLVR
jgi:hypothetical protein